MNPGQPSSVPPRLTRRGFLAGSVTALSAPAVVLPGAGANALAATPADRPSVEPSFVGPHYFDEQERRALMQVMDQASPFRYWGPGRPVQVQQFEEQFSRHMTTQFALGVTSGTAALDCAMAALGIGPGDEVILPAYTWWSDFTCVVHAGALPVFADIDETLNLDPKDFERKISPRTRAVIPVHLLGGPCDMDPILQGARGRGIKVVEDCAQCVGGSYRGKRLGSLGDVGIYSFQINKMITSGEGGALVTNHPLLYERAVRFHDMGSFRSLFEQRTGGVRAQSFAGENFRMNELTGSVLGAQLPKLDRMISDLRRHASAVLEGIQSLQGIRLRRQPDPAGDIGYSVFFQARDRAARDRWIQELRERGVPASTLSGSVLLPVDDAVVQKRARHPNWPSWNSPEGRAMQYGPSCCQRTLELYDRFIQVRMGPNYTDRIDDYLIESIRAVAALIG